MTSRIAALVASLTPLAVLRPWPRYEVDAATWEAIGAALGQGAGELMALWAEPTHVHLALRAPELTNLAVVSLAARVGKARLIDNVLLGIRLQDLDELQ